MQQRHLHCDVDILLSSASVKVAAKRTRHNRRQERRAGPDFYLSVRVQRGRKAPRIRALESLACGRFCQTASARVPERHTAEVSCQRRARLARG